MENKRKRWGERQKEKGRKREREKERERNMEIAVKETCASVRVVAYLDLFLYYFISQEIQGNQH